MPMHSRHVAFLCSSERWLIVWVPWLSTALNTLHWHCARMHLQSTNQQQHLKAVTGKGQLMPMPAVRCWALRSQCQVQCSDHCHHRHLQHCTVLLRICVRFMRISSLSCATYRHKKAAINNRPLFAVIDQWQMASSILYSCISGSNINIKWDSLLSCWKPCC